MMENEKQNCKMMMNVVPSIEDLTKPLSKSNEICTLCNNHFKGISALRRHVQRSHKVKQKNDAKQKYFCPVENCNYNIKNLNSFTNFGAVKQHYKLVHGSDRFKCQRCNRVFKSKYSCKKHQDECGIRYLCSCNVEYATKRGFFEHIKRQRHKIPEKLQAFFDLQSKILKEVKARKAAPKPTITRTSRNNFILPKTSKTNFRVFRMTPNAHIAVTKCIASNNATALLQGDAKDITITSIPQGATIVWPRKTLEKKSFAAQFPQIEDVNNNIAVEPVALQPIPCPETGWTQKNISIQTEESYPNNIWPTDDDVNKLLENIGTQTAESVFDRSFTGTYSTLSQTDICFDLGQDSPSPTLWDQSYNNQAVTFCDAQNQTVSEPLQLPACSTVQDFANDTGNEFDVTLGHPISDNIGNVYSSIETQTDTDIHFLSAQTQTQRSLDFQQQTNINAEIAFDSLNDIQTQTDLFLPPLAPSSSLFVHNCTQTSEPDIIDEILKLNQ